MKFTIEQKMSGTGSIHDLASDIEDRIISGSGKYAVVLSSYYGGKGYTTHKTEEAAIRKSHEMQDYSHKIIDSEGYVMAIGSNNYLVREYALQKLEAEEESRPSMG